MLLFIPALWCRIARSSVNSLITAKLRCSRVSAASAANQGVRPFPADALHHSLQERERERELLSNTALCAPSLLFARLLRLGARINMLPSSQVWRWNHCAASFDRWRRASSPRCPASPTLPWPFPQLFGYVILGAQVKGCIMKEALWRKEALWKHFRNTASTRRRASSKQTRQQVALC